MAIDIEQVSIELKAFVQQFETKWFLGNLSHLIHISPKRPEQLKNVKSAEKQLTYLAALNISSTPTEERLSYTDAEWETMVKYLNLIQEGYEQMFLPKEGDIIDETWIEKRKVVVSSFFSYFNQSELNYKEQVIYRIQQHFNKLETYIKAKFQLEIQDFIDIGLFLDSLNNKKANQNLEGGKGYQDFVEEMFKEGIAPWEFQKHMPSDLTNFFEGFHDRGSTKRFVESELLNVFGQVKTQAFLDLFTIKRNETDFLYYTSVNPLSSIPIIKDSENYQFFQDSMIIIAIYNRLMQTVITENNKIKEIFYKNRGDNLEQKTIDIFRKFYGSDARIYQGYYTDKGNEQDILVLIDHIALIIETKASKIDEPRRDPDKAYKLIKSNFEEVIQKGYDQAYRVKQFFIEKKDMMIYDKKKKPIQNIRTKNYYASYSIIVTQERFCNLQTDLSLMLEIYGDDDFPYSICIDDLEVFLLTLSKMFTKKKEKERRFIDFLQFREKLHGYLISSDELEVVAEYIMNKVSLKDIKSIEKQGYYIPNPHSTNFFDSFYHRGGLGFDNELNLDKKNGNYLIT